MEHRGLFDELSRLAGLRFEINIPIIRSSAISKQSIIALYNLGLIQHKAILRELISGLTEKEYSEIGDGENGPTCPAIAIIDLLGTYSSTRNEIKIFDKACEVTADALGIKLETLVRVVLMHEITHAITHLGIDNDNNMWRNFGAADKDDKELLAQIYPLKYSIAVKDFTAEQAFRNLADHQSARYNLWRMYEDKDIAEINVAMLEIRHKKRAGGKKTKSDKREQGEQAYFKLIWSFQGSGFLAMASTKEEDNAMVTGDGQVLFGTYLRDGFRVRRTAPGKSSPETILKLINTVENAGIMSIPEMTFGPESYIDGGVTDVVIRLRGQERHWVANCEQWDKYESAFDELKRIFQKAVQEAL